MIRPLLGAGLWGLSVMFAIVIVYAITGGPQ